MSEVRDLRFRGAGALTIVAVLLCAIPVLTAAAPGASADAGGSRQAPGYWLVASDGGVFNYGDAGMYGSAGGRPLNKPIVGMAATPDGQGYWLVASDGGVFNYGDAGMYGSAGGRPLNKPIVGMAATPDGQGYWLVASDGGVFNYGDAGMYGSAAGRPLNKPIVGMAATPDGQGYWLVASDGGVFNYGDAGMYGSAGGRPLNKPIVGMAATPDGQGYWLVASDGGVFNYGDAGMYGSAAGRPLNKPIVGMAATPDGQGYWLVASDGGVFNYGDAAFAGSAGRLDLYRPIVAVAASPAPNLAPSAPPRNASAGTTGGGPTPSPAVSIEKTANPTTVTAAGQRVTYTFALKNTGNVTLSSVGVSDAEASPALGSSLGPISCTTGSNGAVTLAAGATGSCSATYTVSQADMDNGSITDTAKATGTPPSGPEVNASSTATVTATQSAGISLTSTPNPTTVTAVGQTLTYTFGLKNTGNVTLSGIGVSVTQTSPSLASGLGPITCTTGTNGAIALAAGATDTCSATYTVSQIDMGNATIKNIATATGTSPSGPAVSATAPATVTTSAIPSGGMSAPAGYSSQQMMFDDQFSGTTLDSSKWVSYLGAEGGVWNDFGQFPPGDSGGNSPAVNNIEWYRPSQVTVNNGLTLTAQPDNTYAGPCSGSGGPPCGRTWVSGVVTTEGKFSLPTSGWYVQVKAKMPDQSQGMWPAIWFLCGTSCPDDNEFDGYEGGWLGASPNQIMHSDYFADQGQRQQAYSVGTDVTAGYHVYGFRFVPGQSITAYFDGKQVWQVTASSGVTITGEPYEILLELQVAGQQTSGWHTVPTGSTGAASMQVAEVQAYS